MDGRTCRTATAPAVRCPRIDPPGISDSTASVDERDLSAAPPLPAPTTAEVRAWARASGLPVPDRGRLRPEIHAAWRDAHPERPTHRD